MCSIPTQKDDGHENSLPVYVSFSFFLLLREYVDIRLVHQENIQRITNVNVFRAGFTNRQIR